MKPLRIGVPIATFHCAAPARCGAFADERRIVAATKADGCGRATLSQPLGQCGSAECPWAGRNAQFGTVAGS